MIITALSVWVGGVLAVSEDVKLSSTLIVAAIAAALVAAGGNSINDAYDEDVDEFNRPNRPIPAGRVDRNFAIVWGGILTVAGVVIGFYLGKTLGLIASGVAVLLWFYSIFWKRSILIGNFTVASCGALTFVFGAVAVDNPVGGMWPALFAFLIHNSREIVKDIEDAAGDRSWGVMTLPVVAGPVVAQKVAASILFLLVGVTIIPYYLHLFSLNYLIIVSALVNLPLIVIIVMLWNEIGDKGLIRVSWILKLIMITGLIALYVG